MNMMTEVSSVADESESNDFRLWMKSMGYNAKQVGLAGERIGMAAAMAGRTGRGERELSETERLAMTTATVGLPSWTPETASEIEAMSTLYTLMKNEIARAKAGSGEEADALRTIRAVIRSEAHRLATESRQENSDPETDRAILALLRAAAQDANAR